MRILGIDKDSEIMKRAEENRQRFVREEEQEMDSEEEMDTENLLVEEKVRDEVKNMETLELMDNLINFLDDY